MDSSAFLLCPSPLELTNNNKDHQNKDNVFVNGDFVFDASLLKKQTRIPRQFLWPHGDLVLESRQELREPIIDLHGFICGDEHATKRAADIIRSACTNHGFFQVVNHGVDKLLITAAHDHMGAFFKLPIAHKLKARKKLGSTWGYSGAHCERFSSKLPWKETFSFGYNDDGCGDNSAVLSYFLSVLGQHFEQTGLVYQKYCEAMKELSQVIMELLAISLGIDRLHFRRFFQDSNSLMRCNYYPPCQEPSLTLGTGPHCDPTSLTILHQDQVGGLEVFAHNKWQSVRPRSDAFVVNIGDTFMALSNGRYKSCLHRAVVNRYKERRSLAFFVCPKEDKIVRPPVDLLNIVYRGEDHHQDDNSHERTRKYPDFTWSDFLDFTQKHYRADVTTLQSFTNWLLSTSNSSTAATSPNANNNPSSSSPSAAATN
ncbi:hypothetical protein MKX03_000384 [Papaver bracteatum]|nr:hypothetical protein MKX03_000384 [Papaver bracteatum]